MERGARRGEVRRIDSPAPETKSTSGDRMIIEEPPTPPRAATVAPMITGQWIPPIGQRHAGATGEVEGFGGGLG